MTLRRGDTTLAVPAEDEHRWSVLGLLCVAIVLSLTTWFSATAIMSECERRDIGLTAFDVENALTLPVDRDPTEVLAKVVDDRRHHREF